MRTKLTILGIILLIVAYTQFIPSPLNALVAFIIAGIIPGTTIMLGVWPVLGLICIIALLLRAYILHIRFKFLENTAKTITSERLLSEFKQSNSSDTPHKNKAVIASPFSERS